jgi:arylsulfatase A
LRAGKGSPYEGGFRGPAIFRWPAKIPAHARNNAVIGNLDIFPTIAAVTGAPLPKNKKIDGISILPLLTGKSNSSPHEYFNYFGGSNEGRINYVAIRNDRWKLHISVSPEGEVVGKELYDLNADISERFNRIDRYPEVAESLKMAAGKFYRELSVSLRPAGHVKPN